MFLKRRPSKLTSEENLHNLIKKKKNLQTLYRMVKFLTLSPRTYLADTISKPKKKEREREREKEERRKKKSYKLLRNL